MAMTMSMLMTSTGKRRMILQWHSISCVTSMSTSIFGFLHNISASHYCCDLSVSLKSFKLEFAILIHIVTNLKKNNTSLLCRE